MQEIKAEDLKWCPVDFSFFKKEHEHTIFSLKNVIEGQVFANCWPDYLGSMSSSDEILVHPEEYEKAVIERIKDFSSREITYIQKDNRGKVFAHWQYTTASGGIMRGAIATNADPRPWEETYTIKLE